MVMLAGSPPDVMKRGELRVGVSAVGFSECLGQETVSVGENLVYHFKLVADMVGG
jgi:hypothetical protein